MRAWWVVPPRFTAERHPQLEAWELEKLNELWREIVWARPESFTRPLNPDKPYTLQAVVDEEPCQRLEEELLELQELDRKRLLPDSITTCLAFGRDLLDHSDRWPPHPEWTEK